MHKDPKEYLRHIYDECVYITKDGFTILQKDGRNVIDHIFQDSVFPTSDRVTSELLQIFRKRHSDKKSDLNDKYIKKNVRFTYKELEMAVWKSREIETPEGKRHALQSDLFTMFPGNHFNFSCRNFNNEDNLNTARIKTLRRASVVAHAQQLPEEAAKILIQRKEASDKQEEQKEILEYLDEQTKKLVATEYKLDHRDTFEEYVVYVFEKFVKKKDANDTNLRLKHASSIGKLLTNTVRHFNEEYNLTLNQLVDTILTKITKKALGYILRNTDLFKQFKSLRIHPTRKSRSKSKSKEETRKSSKETA